MGEEEREEWKEGEREEGRKEEREGTQLCLLHLWDECSLSSYLSCSMVSSESERNINDSTLPSVCYTAIYMVRVGVRVGLGLV